jgi:hypothetical protein
MKYYLFIMKLSKIPETSGPRTAMSVCDHGDLIASRVALRLCDTRSFVGETRYCHLISLNSSLALGLVLYSRAGTASSIGFTKLTLFIIPINIWD